MKTRATIDPELLPLIEQMPVFDFAADLPGCRKMIDEFMLSARAESADPHVAVEERRVPGPAGAPEVPVLVYRPRGLRRPLPALLDIHGGGYVSGLAVADEPAKIRTVKELGCIVLDDRTSTTRDAGAFAGLPPTYGYEFAAQARVSIASERERQVALARAFGISLGAEVNA